MRLFSRRLLALPIVVPLLVAAGACGSDSSASTPTAAASPSASATAATSTASPAASPSASASAGASATAVAADPAAVQVIVDYYNAINDKQFDAAYKMWASGGAASGQTSQQFASGFAQTVRSVVHLGRAAAKDSGVEVPATVLAVINTSASAQAVRHFAGTYTLAQSGGAWHIASASLAKKDDLTDTFPDTASDTGTLQAYYAAINDGAFAEAYTYWEDNGAASQQKFAQFVQGYAKTTNTVVTLGTAQPGAAAGSAYADIPVFIVGKQADGSQQAFCGKVTMRRSNVPPFQLLGWEIYSAAIAPHAGAVPSADGIQALLKNQCQG